MVDDPGAERKKLRGSEGGMNGCTSGGLQGGRVKRGHQRTEDRGREQV